MEETCKKREDRHYDKGHHIDQSRDAEIEGPPPFFFESWVRALALGC